MTKGEILTAYEEGKLPELLEKHSDLDDLDDIHSAMFSKSLQLGVSRQDVTRRMDRVNYEIARQHLLDEAEIKFINRRRLKTFDPVLAVAVYRGQIDALVEAMDVEMARQEEVGITPEIEMFNTTAIGQTLSSASLDGHPDVAILTGLAKINEEQTEIIMGLIGNTRVHKNLKENPRAVFTALGPSMDSKRWSGIRIHVTMTGDEAEGAELDDLRKTSGVPLSNRLIFKIDEIETLFIPKSQ